MTSAITTIRRPPSEAIAQLERVVIEGDLAFLKDGERVAYYARVCESLGLNPLTRPFEYIRLNNKLTLYARKDATDQLRKINGVSVEKLDRERDADLDLAIVTAHGRDRTGRMDSSIGAVSIKGLAGEALANALMKAETKAKRRLTLSLAGLGWLDEIETDSVVASSVSVDPVTGAIETTEGEERQSALRDRITERTAALRGESTGEPEASVPSGGAEPEVESTPSGGSPARGGDPWMRRLHAVGNERGMDHDALHDWAVQHFGVGSITDLTTPQRATFMELVERMPLMYTPTPDSDPVEASEPGGPVGPPDEPPAPSPTLDDVVRVSGGELVPEKANGRSTEEAIADAEAKAKKAKVRA
jgi:hypothetical protein